MLYINKHWQSQWHPADQGHPIAMPGPPPSPVAVPPPAPTGHAAPPPIAPTPPVVKSGTTNNDSPPDRRTLLSALLAFDTYKQSWIISTLIHTIIFLLIAVLLPQKPAADSPRAIAFSLGKTPSVLGDGGGDGEEAGGGGGENGKEITLGDIGSSTSFRLSKSKPAGTLADAVTEAAPVDPLKALPAGPAVGGAGGLEGGVGSAFGDGSGPSRGSGGGAGGGHGGGLGSGIGPGIGSGRGTGGKGRTSIFGAEGEGYKFVYVFDRSGSMGGSGRNALTAAKIELMRSLRGLEQQHQFGIIFYNEQVSKFSPSGDADRLVFATPQNKSMAEKFIASIYADDGTDHEKALVAAFRMRPDVIFLLTDADEPKLWPAQLAKLHRMAGGITINTIEFGMGPAQGDRNFLVQLAEDNGGKHVYVDITRLGLGGK